MKREELIDNMLEVIDKWGHNAGLSYQRSTTQENKIAWDKILITDILDLMPFDEMRKFCKFIMETSGCMTTKYSDAEYILSLLPEPETEPDLIWGIDVADNLRTAICVKKLPDGTFQLINVEQDIVDLPDFGGYAKGINSDFSNPVHEPPKPDEPKALRPCPHCGGELYEAPSEIKDDEVYPPDEPKAELRKRLNDAMSDLVLEISVDMHKGKSKKMCEYTDRIMAAIGGGK